MKKKVRILVASMTALFLCTISASANNLLSSVFGVGVQNLISDVSATLVILSPITGGAAAGYFFIRRGMADEQDGKMWNHRIKTAVICGVGGMLGAALVNVLSSYF